MTMHTRTNRFIKTARFLLCLILVLFMALDAGLPAAAVSEGGQQGDVTSLSETCRGTDGKTYRVTVRYGADTAIPSDAKLSVSAVSEDDSAYYGYVSRAADALSCSITENEFRLFDISLVSENDPSVSYQPAEGSTVEVRVRLASSINAEMNVVHFGETVEQLEVETNERTVSFETTGFSVYALVDVNKRDNTVHDVSGFAEAPLYLSATTESTPHNTYFVSSGITTGTGQGDVINRTVANETEGAAAYCFDLVDGTENQFYMYLPVSNGSRQYVDLSNPTKAKYKSTPGTAFTIIPCGADKPDKFYLSFVVGSTTYYFNLRKDDNGKGFNGSTYGPPPQVSAGSEITAYRYLSTDEDPLGLDGKTFGIVWRDDYSGAFALSAEAVNSTVLAADETKVKSNPLNLGETVVVRTGGDITMFTFRLADEGGFHITTKIGGNDKYLRITSSGASLVDVPDEYCAFSVTAGTGADSGKIKITSIPSSGGDSLCIHYKESNGFSESIGFSSITNVQSGYTKKKVFFYLAEPSNLEGDDLVSYSASKISVTDVRNGQKVVVYTRVWDEDEKTYVYYGINYDGSLVRLYDEGETVRWTGTQINTMLWNFTEYYYWLTIIPNHYYDLRNTYSGKYLAPQHHNGQILQNTPIGVNLNGRRTRKQYTTIIAWDNYRYDYSGLKAGDGRIEAVRMSKAQDFYFAVMNPQEGELTTVKTIDHTDYGITMKMVEFPREKETGDGSRNNFQTEIIGTENLHPDSKDLKFPTVNLASNHLDSDGYPMATATETSFSALFGNATEVNKLFLEEVYRESGYFQYDSTQNFATLLDPAGNVSNTFTVYNELGTIETSTPSQGHSQFMPYNDLDTSVVSEYTNIKDVFNEPLALDNPRLGEQLYSIPRNEANYHFGMEMEANFVQSKDGKDAWGHDIIFEFSGDDDMWLYVDGELVLDLGGIHSALVGKINYRTGEVQIPSTTEATGNHATPVHTDLRTIFANNYIARESTDENPLTEESPEVIEYLNRFFKEGTSVFKDYTAHTMKMFYMERGAGASNLIMRFNLTTSSEGQLILSKKISGTDKQDYSGAEFPFQVFYKNSDNEFVTIGHTAQFDNGMTADQYKGVNFVNYKDTTDPVKYQAEYYGYDDVFFLKPGEEAEIQFPSNDIEYYVRECRIDTTIFDAVYANNNQLSPVQNGDYYDFSTEPEIIGERKVVVYDNHVDQSALMTLTITKALYELQDTEDNRLHYADDDTGFRFRVYIGKDGEELDYYRFGDYYIKNNEGYYCKYDYVTQKFVSVGVNDFSQLTEEQKEDCQFTTSPSGAIDQIPADFVVEIRDLFIDTDFMIVEKDSDIPKGYDLIGYVRDDGTLHADEGESANIGKIHRGENPCVTVKNHRGWGLTVEKYWTDDDFMLSHDNIYFGVYYDGELIPNTLRQMKTEVTADNPEAEYSLYYYFRDLIDGAHFSDYVVKELAVENPVVDENGYVTSCGSITQLGGSVKLNGGGIDSQTNTHESYNYTVTYSVGEPTGANRNVRTDDVTNARPGIRFMKTDANGNPLSGAVFTMKAEGLLNAEFTSDSDGLVTIAYPLENVEYKITEIETPSGYSAIADTILFKVVNGELTVTSNGDEAVTVSQMGADGMIDVSVDNYETDFSVVKVDEESNEPIKGAHFALYPQVEGMNGVMRKDYYPLAGYDNLVSNAEGVIPLINESLPAGVYYLTETVAPNSYIALDEDVCFRISNIGVITVLSGDATVNSPDPDENGKLVYELSVKNRRSFKSLILSPQTLIADFGLNIEYDVTLNNYRVPDDSSYEYIGITSVENFDEQGTRRAPSPLTGIGVEHTGKYGRTTISAAGIAHYEIDTMAFSGEDSFCLVASVSEIDGEPVENLYVYEMLTFIPATTVYYEDNFRGVGDYVNGTHTLDAEKLGEEFKPGEWSVVGDESNIALQAADVAAVSGANIFGYDPAYTAFGSYSHGTAHKVTVSNYNSPAKGGTWPYVEFDFAGTGFDLVSVTGGDTGVFAVKVFPLTTDSDGNVTTGKAVKNQVVDTYYGYEYGRLYLDSDGEATLEDTGTPLFKATQSIINGGARSGLLKIGGRYVTVDEVYYDAAGGLTETPQYYDADGNTVQTPYYVKIDDPEDVRADVPAGEEELYTPNYAYAFGEGWMASSSADKSLYQIPVLKIRGLEYGSYRARIEPRFISTYGHFKTFDYDENTKVDHFDLYVDAFRVYDPAGVSEKGTLTSKVIREAYSFSSEANQKFTTLKNVIVGSDSLSLDEDTPGMVLVDGNVPLTTEQISDYAEFGPNNELYLGKGMSVAFRCCATETPADLQIQMKKVSENDPSLRVTYVGDDNTVFTNTMDVCSATDLSYSVPGLIGKDNVKWQKLKKADNFVSSGLIILTNASESNSTISITNLKWTFASPGNGYSIPDGNYWVSVAPKSVSNVKNVMAFAAKGVTETQDEAASAVYNDGIVTLTVTTGNEVETLVIKDRSGNLIDEELIDISFEDVDESLRQWTVTLEDVNDNLYTLRVYAQSDGYSSGEPILVTVYDAETAPEEPSDPNVPEDPADPADPSEPGGEEPGSGNNESFFRKIRNIRLRFIELLKKILEYFKINF